MADENAQAAEGGDQQPSIDFNDPAIQKYVKTQVEKEVGGLKKKNDELLGKIRDFKDERLDGIDPGKLKAMLAQFDDEAERKALQEGRIDDVVKGRVEAIQKQLAAKDSAMNELQKAREAAEQEAQTLRDRYQSSVINNQIASSVGDLQKGALKLVAQMTQGWFSLDENENPQPTDRAPLNNKGEPLAFNELRDYLLREHEYLFVPSRGAGLTPGKAGPNGARVVTRDQFRQFGPTEKRKFLDLQKEGKAELTD